MSIHHPLAFNWHPFEGAGRSSPPPLGVIGVSAGKPLNGPPSRTALDSTVWVLNQKNMVKLRGYTLPEIYNEKSGNLGGRKQAPPLVDSLMDSKLLIVIVMWFRVYWVYVNTLEWNQSGVVLWEEFLGELRGLIFGRRHSQHIHELKVASLVIAQPWRKLIKKLSSHIVTINAERIEFFLVDDKVYPALFILIAFTRNHQTYIHHFFVTGFPLGFVQQRPGQQKKARTVKRW